MPVSVDSPFKHSPRKRCDCQFEILSLKSAVANLEHWCGSMRDDITTLKSEAARKQFEFDKSIQAMLGHHGNTQNETITPYSRSPSIEMLPAVSVTSTSTPTQAPSYRSTPSAASSVRSLSSSAATYGGITKEQLMAELSWQKNYKKGTSRAFRMLFSPEETIGRSLNGQGSMWGMRPALEDRGKLKFLEDCVKEQWVECSVDQIRTVIRHHLKPSRNGKKTQPELENSALEELDESIDSYFV